MSDDYYFNNSRYQQTPTLPIEYLQDGYFENDSEKDGKKLKREFILDYAKDLSEKFAFKNKMKKYNLRKFYNYCIQLKVKMNARGGKIEYILEDIAKLVPLSFQAVNKSPSIAPQIFAEFFEKNVNAIKTEDDFKAFLKHFEAIVAYFEKSKS